jgi:nickel/cobalt exporter
MSATEPARLWTVAVTAAVATGMVVLAMPATPASAHPLGNFSVNQYDGLALSPDQVSVSAVVNTAELPTLQERSIVDANHDRTVTDAERAAYTARACADVAKEFEVQVGGERLSWTVNPGDYQYAPGAGGLSTARLSCGLTAPARLAVDVGGPAATTVTVANHYRGDRVGWREMTATGTGVHLVDSPLPEHSTSQELRSYPDVSSPTSVVDVRTATLKVAPGSGQSSSTAASRPRSAGALTASTLWAERHFEQLAAGRLTPVLAILAVLLALLLGAGHAALPGHGKTVLAAYLAGRAGRPRDALVIGATVTATHTGGVLLIGLLLSTSTALAGDRLLGYLGVASGVLIVAVGLGMLTGAIRHSAHPDHAHTPDPDRDRDHGHGHEHERGHEHEHDHGHEHERGHDHGHGHEHGRAGGRLGLAGIGVAGGLVPSPSALVVLLAAVGLGRAAFGVLLVIAYGLGMAATLTAAGLLLLAVQRRVTRTSGRLSRLATRLPRAAPLVTSGLVVLIGLGLAVRAGAGLI